MNKHKGFTLIEILIALVVFAIMATITSSTLYYAFNTRTRVNEQSERLSTLQLAVSLIQQDTRQAIGRAVRANDMMLTPVFLGKTQSMEFTRDGNVNPKSMEKRSTLKRIAYVCKNNALVRRTWNSLDMENKSKYEEKLLIDRLTNCHFNYLNPALGTFPDWRADATEQSKGTEPLPQAIQVNLTLRDLGEINLLFTLPETLYVTNK